MKRKANARTLEMIFSVQNKKLLSALANLLMLSFLQVFGFHGTKDRKKK